MKHKKKYAVIGSNSFGGSAFVANLLANGNEVIGFNRSAESSPIFLPYLQSAHAHNYHFIKADINYDLKKIMSDLDQFEPEFIVDFAGQGMVAESWENPSQWYQTNIVSKVSFHDQLRSRKWLKRYLRISTPEVYGSQESLIAEGWVFNPSTPYAVSHAAIDMSLRTFHQQYGFPVIFTRFANFYGPGQQLYRIVPRAIICALSGKKLQLQGGGSSIRAFIHSQDMVEGIKQAIDRGIPGEIYHFSPREFLSICEVVNTIAQHIDVPFSQFVEMAPDRPGKDHAYLMDSSKAREVLGWRDEISFNFGVEQTIDWIKSSFNEIKLLPHDYIHKP